MVPGCVSCGADSRGRGGALRECTVPERARERQCRHADDEPHRCGVLRVCAVNYGAWDQVPRQRVARALLAALPRLHRDFLTEIILKPP